MQTFIGTQIQRALNVQCCAFDELFHCRLRLCPDRCCARLDANLLAKTDLQQLEIIQIVVRQSFPIFDQYLHSAFAEAFKFCEPGMGSVDFFHDPLSLIAHFFAGLNEPLRRRLLTVLNCHRRSADIGLKIRAVLHEPFLAEEQLHLQPLGYHRAEIGNLLQRIQQSDLIDIFPVFLEL